jgi:hypothetical protein
MMDANPRSRIRVGEIIHHSWLAGGGDSPTGCEKELGQRLDALTSLAKTEQESAYARKAKRGPVKKEERKCAQPELSQ